MDEGEPGRNFSLVHDKSLASQVELASWSPDKDVVALLTADGQLLLHRLNWQKLWSLQPEGKVTALSWSPDGKILAVGQKDGSIALRDVENGDVKKVTAPHDASVECLCWTRENSCSEGNGESFSYQDPTSKFFPPAPTAPLMPGAAPKGLFDSQRKGNNDFGQKKQLTILCSGDSNGCICFTIFGVYLVGKLSLRDIDIERSKIMFESSRNKDEKLFRVPDASVCQVVLSQDLKQLSVVFRGTPKANPDSLPHGLYTVLVDTSLLGDRRRELRQVSVQAWRIAELMVVAKESLEAMEQYWKEAMTSFTEKMKLLSGLLIDHGSFVGPRDELLSLLSCGSASSALHQFLASSLGEQGLKRLAKGMDSASLHLHCLLTEHLQPSLEETAFRLGELRGLARWRSRGGPIGVEEEGVEGVLEDVGMAIVQSERVLRLNSKLSIQFRMLFVWLVKALRQLNDDSRQGNETSANIDTAAVAEFLRTNFESDPLGPHFSPSSEREVVDLSEEEKEAMEEMSKIGGFSDSHFLQKTLRQQVDALIQSCDVTFGRAFEIISPMLRPMRAVLLSKLFENYTPFTTPPLSLTYQEIQQETKNVKPKKVLYIAFEVNDESLPKIGPRISRSFTIMRIISGFKGEGEGEGEDKDGGGGERVEAIGLRLAENLHLVDMAFYKDCQLALLLWDRSSGLDASLLLLQTTELELQILNPFLLSPMDSLTDIFQLCESQGCMISVCTRNGKARELKNVKVVRPFAVSASRGLACIPANHRRVFIFDLEEDEQPKDDDVE